jgi:hypothetical protein
MHQFPADPLATYSFRYPQVIDFQAFAPEPAIDASQQPFVIIFDE